MADDLLVSPYAAEFCRDGEKWITSADVDEAQKVRCVNAVQDWLVLRRSAREEAHILKLNKIGIERDEKAKRENVAKHVGLAMPKVPNRQ